ncbi:MAG TPA: diguanylate cyclase [Candidatus Acidoferrales bacterium]|nr:diguanylate cyclase [Candidatus Acidoferrales bacterium]
MKILIADDDPVSRRLLENLLRKWDYEVVPARDGQEAWGILRAPGAPRLALLDWMMPGMNGLEICRELRKDVAGNYTYVILVTARDSKIDVIEGLEAGADDYLTKLFHPEELHSRLRVGQRILDLEDRLVAARELLQFKASHDELTGLWNRGAVLEVLKRELARARRSAPLGIILADLDRFKQVNDTHGHQVGDEVLQEVGRRMIASVRSYDSVGRYGGEEFLILVSGCDESAASESADRLREQIAQPPIQTSAGPVSVTLSLGSVSSATFGDADSDALLRAADVALYLAKKAGRNRVAIALPDDVSASCSAPAERPPAESAAAPLRKEEQRHSLPGESPGDRC